MNTSNDNLSFTIKFTINKKWIPVFSAFLNKLLHNSKFGHSSLIGFYADGEKDFRFNASVVEDSDLKKEFGYDSWTGNRAIDSDKIYAKPVMTNVKLQNNYAIDEIEEVYDAE